MSEELEVLKEVAGKLNGAGILYMISGSVAMNFHAQPRMTRDIDIVIHLMPADIKKFMDLFKDDFYLEEETVRAEVERKGMFNLIHNKYIIKIDFILQKEDVFSRSAFGRRFKADIDGVMIDITSAEDLIIAKLNWAKDSMSEMQIRDVKNIKNYAKNLDIKYVEQWVDKLGLKEIYGRVQ